MDHSINEFLLLSTIVVTIIFFHKTINNLPQGNLNDHWLRESSLADDILIKLYYYLYNKWNLIEYRYVIVL